MAVALAIPIDENNRFLALVVLYVSRLFPGPSPGGHEPARAGHARNCRVFCRLLAAMETAGGAYACNPQCFSCERKQGHGGVGIVGY